MPSSELWKYIETNPQTVFFYLKLVSLPHFFMIFKEKSWSCYILLTDQITVYGCLYFVKYCTIYVLQLFVNQVVTL